MSKYVALVLLLATPAAWGQPVLDIKFGDGDSAPYFEKAARGVALGVSADGTKCLGMDGSVISLALKPVPVRPLEKYKLTIRAAVEGKDTMESNDRIADFARQTGGRTVAGYALTFLDAEGRQTGFILRGTALVANSGTILSGTINDVVQVFYSPPRANTMQLVLSPRKHKLLVESIRLEVEQNEGTVNCNPDFRYGELSPSGWSWDSEGRLYRRPDGKTVLKSGVSGNSPIFPVSDQSRYSFYCRGSAYEIKQEFGNATVSFYDETGGNLGGMHLFWAEAMGEGAKKTQIKPPPGATQAQVNLRRVIFEELRVTEDIRR